MLVCLDETSKQLVGETRQPRPTRPGSPLTCDYAYRRNGVSNLFMLYAPLEGWRWVSVTERHARRDYGGGLRQLVDESFPHKERISAGDGQPRIEYGAGSQHPSSGIPVRSLRAGGGPADSPAAGNPLHTQAWQLAESCPEPVEGMAESELGALARQCLARRIPSREVLERETDAWQQRRNQEGIRADWRFTTQSLPSATTGGRPHQA